MPEILLSLKPAEAYNYRSWAERIGRVVEDGEDPRLVARIEEARSLGASGILAVMSDELTATLEYLRRRQRWDFYPVVPNMFAFIRDQTELGMVGAGRRRLMRLGPVDLIRFGLWAVRHVGGVARRDFTVGALLVLRAEFAALRRLRPDGAYIHPQLTELALATGNGAFFRDCCRELERAFGFRPGLITHNPVRARALLDEWQVPCPSIVAPLNGKAYKMFPDRQRCEELFRRDPRTMVASEITAGGCLAPAAALAYLREQGVQRIALDLREVGGFFRELERIELPDGPAQEAAY